MQIGASTACLYPLPTEEALKTLLNMGFRTVEIFLNTPSETDKAFTTLLSGMADEVGAKIVAIHPYCSLGEPYYLFSLYERRFYDYLDEYRRQYEAAARLGAQFLVLHGDRAVNPTLSPEQFAARYAALYDAGQEFGVTLLQENVVRFRAEHPHFVKTMRHLLGEKAGFVLDLKQCRRAGVSPTEMLDAMGSALRHVHLSDATADKDCLLPGAGNEDFASLFSALKTSGFDAAGVIELYRHNFGEATELWQGYTHLLPFA